MSLDWADAAAVGFVLWLVWGHRRQDADVGKSRREVLQLFSSRGWPTDEAHKFVEIESGWKPSARNRESGAVGLLQFMPSTLRRLGWVASPESFGELTTAEQVPWIRTYLARLPSGSGIPGDTYLLGAGPVGIGKPDAFVVYPVGSPGWRANSLWHAPGEPVTAGSLRRVLLSRMGR